MGIDQPDVDDAPDAGRKAADGAVLADGADGVVRDARERAARHDEYRAAVEEEYREHRAAIERESGTGRESWDADVPELRRAWVEHETRWPLPKRSEAPPPPDSPDAQESPDAPGAWRGDGWRRLTPEANAEVDRGCERIREVGENVIVPGLRGIEAEDPGRQLVGFEYRFKGPDRIKEKVAEELEARPGMTPAQAVSSVPDGVRFSFCYPEERYAAGVTADLERLSARGFELAKPLKNAWASDQYKGINTQWREPETGQRFEAQFHTRASFEAKQLTHEAYERIRNPQISGAELERLENFQRQVCAKIPIPPDAAGIDYRRREHDG